MIRVLIIDDDFMVAKVHAGFIQHTPGFSVVGAAHTGAEALVKTRELQPDLVLLDIHLPDANGLDLMLQLRDVAPELDVLVISAAREVETVRRALRGGSSTTSSSPSHRQTCRNGWSTTGAPTRAWIRPRMWPSSRT